MERRGGSENIRKVESRSVSSLTTYSHRPGSGRAVGTWTPNVTGCSSGEQSRGTLKFQLGQWASGSPAPSPYSGFVRIRTRLPSLKTLCYHPLTCMYNVRGLQCQYPQVVQSATYTIPLGGLSRHTATEQALGRWSAGVQAGRNADKI